MENKMAGSIEGIIDVVITHKSTPPRVAYIRREGGCCDRLGGV